MKNFFNDFCEKFSENLKQENIQFEQKENEINFKIGEKAYLIHHSPQNKILEFKICCDFEQNEENNWQVLSSWLFNSDATTAKDIKIICEEFINLTRETPKNMLNSIKNKSVSSEDNTDFSFFMNRMITYLPELKDKWISEKQKQGDLKILKFSKNNLLPNFLRFVNENKNNKKKISKFFGVLENLYNNGDENVRSIITMVLLNGVENDRDLIQTAMTAEFKKVCVNSLKLKNKKVKPEKPKIKKTFFTKFLADSK